MKTDRWMHFPAAKAKVMAEIHSKINEGITEILPKCQTKVIRRWLSDGKDF
jgi:hypothetical protein